VTVGSGIAPDLLTLGGLLAIQALAGCCLVRQIPPVGISTPP